MVNQGYIVRPYLKKGGSGAANVGKMWSCTVAGGGRKNGDSSAIENIWTVMAKFKVQPP